MISRSLEEVTLQKFFPITWWIFPLDTVIPETNLRKFSRSQFSAIDNWCSEYEQKIRDKGGIGFFLGGIGPDGHIAFNIRGSDHHSTTRLTKTNFETQAVAASDLGGIEISRNRLVITIGLETITYNPDAVALIFAAGEAKASMVQMPWRMNLPTSIRPVCFPNLTKPGFT